MKRVWIGIASLGVLALGVWAYVDLKARTFHAETVRTRFFSYATEVSASSRFQFATLKQVELFERRSTATLFWKRLQLPDVVVSAKAPVTYTYYVELNDQWEFKKQGNTIKVIIPEPQANEPAVDISKLSFEIEEGSLFRNEKKVMETLQTHLMDILRKKSHRKHRHRPRIRQTPNPTLCGGLAYQKLHPAPRPKGRGGLSR